MLSIFFTAYKISVVGLSNYVIEHLSLKLHFKRTKAKNQETTFPFPKQINISYN